jgi:hypothetical protein
MCSYLQYGYLRRREGTKQGRIQQQETRGGAKKKKKKKGGRGT